MGVVLVVAFVVVQCAAAATGWRTARATDNAYRTALGEMWQVTLADPATQRAFVLRFWPDGQIEMVWYVHGARGTGWSSPSHLVAGTGSDVVATSPDTHASGEIRLPHIAARDVTARFAVDVTAAHTRRGPTIGPLNPWADQKGWLAVPMVGDATGSITWDNRKIAIRGWRVVQTHEWATWNWKGITRGDLALAFGPRDSFALIWGVEGNGGIVNQGIRAHDDLWRGVIARVGAKTTVCQAMAHHGKSMFWQLKMSFPTLSLRATCGGGTIAIPSRLHQWMQTLGGGISQPSYAAGVFTLWEQRLNGP